MFATRRTILFLAIAALLLTASTSYAIYAPQVQWDITQGGSNTYYGSGTTYNGQAYFGKIGYGPLAYDNDDTNTPTGNPYEADNYFDDAGAVGAKSVAPLNGQIYVGASQNLGIYQLDADDPWTNQLPDGSFLGNESECIVTDGTYLYGNEDRKVDGYTRGDIYRYSVTSGSTPSLSVDWKLSIPGNPRIRGFTYNAHFDELYVGDHQQNAIFKVTNPGSASPALVAIGNHIDNDGEYQVARYGSGNELYVVGESFEGGSNANLMIYTLNSTTGMIQGAPQEIDLGLGNCYGLALEGNGRDAMGMWVASIGAHMSYWELRHNGDATEDGIVDVSDLGALATAYGQTGQQWTDGDFTGDGLVDVSDLGVLATEYGWTATPAAAVPEPATLGMLLLGALALLLRRRCK